MWGPWEESRMTPRFLPLAPQADGGAISPHQVFVSLFGGKGEVGRVWAASETAIQVFIRQQEKAPGVSKELRHRGAPRLPSGQDSGLSLP